MKPDTYYHIFNHANGDENLFRSDENYHYFLKQWAKYIEPVAGTYAYCLLPNHFHFLIKTNDFKGTFGKANTSKENTLEVSKNLQGVFVQAFSNLFNSYTKAFNKYYNRRGSLFMPNFKRKEIDNHKYLATIVTYIHRNPIHHGFKNHISDWPHCSYDAMFGTKSTKLKRAAVQKWYGSSRDYRLDHRMEVRLPDTSLFIDY